VRIPLHDLLIGLRRDRAKASAGAMEKLAFRLWSLAWSRPGLYRLSTRAARHLPVNKRGLSPFMHAPVVGRWLRTRDVVVKR
jgi:L-lactate utilization protein LutB